MDHRRAGQGVGSQVQPPRNSSTDLDRTEGNSGQDSRWNPGLQTFEHKRDPPIPIPAPADPRPPAGADI